ncbi:hypothetical protein C8Q74DRAFT_1279226 [Fomes fomentarius]|nr:hypothetical protein C8Q74DRAFT_1279226 [Fomes fomentarius]
MSKVVFVGNVPYNMAEADLIDVFKSVGQVAGLRLVFDRDTGKPKGYGFCEFADHETALSAVRNLNGHELGGRPLRIDLADSDPFLEGKTTVRGEIIDGGETRAQWRERHDRERHGDRHEKDYRGNDINVFLASIQKGVPLPDGTNSLDVITQVLGTTETSKTYEVLAQMKAFVITHPEYARALLVAHPQLGYALFQALLVHNIVDRAILNRMLDTTRAAIPQSAPTPTPAPAHPPHPAPPPYLSAPPSQPQPSMYPPSIPPPSHTPVHHPTPPLPPPHMYGQPPPQMPSPYYRGPPPGQAVPPHPQQLPPPGMPPPGPLMPPAAPTPQPNLPENFPDQQRQMLMQVLGLSQEQLNSLPPAEREAIMQLQRQFGMSQ